jgi:SAM-dependent methyltransferase
MISRRWKAAYYQLFALPMWVNGRLYRAWRAPRTGIVKVHLGPGQENYLPGWINVDANRFTARVDVWANLLDPLPFPDATVDVFYSHHVIEHLPDAHLPTHFRDMHRALKPGGVIRVGGPNIDNAIRKFVEGDESWFWNFPDDRRSLGGKFANFLLCRGEHLTVLTFSYLEELLTDAGFSAIRACKPTTETFHPDFFPADVLVNERESDPDVPHTLMVEATRA